MTTNGEYALEIKDLNCYYGRFRAVKDSNLKIERQKIKKQSPVVGGVHRQELMDSLGVRDAMKRLQIGGLCLCRKCA